MRRILVIAAAVTVVGGASVASAASLGLSSSTLAAGSATVTSCQTTPPEVALEVQGSQVVASLDGLASACDGSRLRLVLLDAGGAPLGSGSLASVPGTRPVTAPTDLGVGDVGSVTSMRLALAGRP